MSCLSVAAGLGVEAALRSLLSERGLIRARIRVEALWVTHLASAAPHFAGSKPVGVISRTAEPWRDPPIDAAYAETAGAAAKLARELCRGDVATECQFREAEVSWTGDFSSRARSRGSPSGGRDAKDRIRRQEA